jgi:site-specific DNA-cytosine methylase
VLRAVDAGRWVRRPDRLDLPFNRGEVSTCPIVDGARLQGFPADYPWRGTTTKQAKQLGDAVPPPLAVAIVSTVAGFDVSEAAA